MTPNKRLKDECDMLDVLDKFKRKPYIGIDFGHNYAHFSVIYFEKSENITETYRIAWNTGQPPLDEFKAISSKFPGDCMTTAVIPAHIHSYYIELPIMKTEEIKTALNTKIRKYFPLQNQKHSMTYAEIPPFSLEKKLKGYMVVIFEKESMENCTSFLKSAGFKLAHIDIPYNAITRWLLWNDPGLEKGNHLFLSISNSNNGIFMGGFSDKILYFTYFITPGFMQIPQWKEMSAGKTEPFKPFIVHFSQELKELDAYIRFRAMPREMNIDTVQLVGDLAHDPLIVSAVEQGFNCPVKVPALNKLKFKQIPEGSSPMDFITSAGLSLRVMEDWIWV